MKEIGMLFSNPMVNADLQGIKTETRRTSGLDLINKNPDKFRYVGNSLEIDVAREAKKYDDSVYYRFELKNSNEVQYVAKCPYGKPGDLIWVRETFRYCQPYGSESLNYQYKDMEIGQSAIGPDDYLINDYDKWKPSLHMPKQACRIWKKVREINLERLHDITKEGALAEGINVFLDKGSYRIPLKKLKVGAYRTLDPVDAYIAFVNVLNGFQRDYNPWVWVVKYKILSTNGRPSI